MKLLSNISKQSNKQSKFNMEECESIISYLELHTIIYCRICTVSARVAGTFREIFDNTEFKTGK